MAVTATTVAAAIMMLAAVAAVFLTLLLCFYIFLCAKRYRGGAPPHAGAAGGGGARAWLLRVAFGGAGRDGGGAAEWCREGGLDDKAMAKLPRREVARGEALDCAVCIAEVAPGEAARVLPRCGHGFHADCVDVWLRSHSTCPLCRCPAVDDPPGLAPLPTAVPTTPEADRESPNFPTNVLFFGSQDEVSTGRSQQHGGLIGCGGATPPTQPPHPCDRHQHHHQEEQEDAGGDIEMGLAAAGESSAWRPVMAPQPGS